MNNPVQHILMLSAALQGRRWTDVLHTGLNFIPSYAGKNSAKEAGR